MAMCEEVPRLHLDPTSDCTMKLRGVVGEFLEKAGSGSPRLFLPLLVSVSPRASVPSEHPGWGSSALAGTWHHCG
jgi:hypothetical protein